MTNLVADVIGRTEFAEFQSHDNMTVVPLITDWPEGPDYLTLAQAQQDGLLSVKEVSHFGSVPQLRVENNSEQPVLLLDGEELAGAKQNRVVNTTILLREKSVTVIPVSCTEQGRWSYESPEFTESGVVMSPRLRTAKTRSVSDSLKSSRRFDSDQTEVWQEIHDLSLRSETWSATGAMRDIFRLRNGQLGEFCDYFRPVSGQTGLLVLINGVVVGCDILSRRAAYERLAAKLVKSYAIEATLELGEGKNTDIPAAARKFLGQVAKAEGVPYESVGYGQDYRFSGRGVVGSALVVDDAVIHTAFFAAGKKKRPGGISALHRRRHFGSWPDEN